MKLKSKKLTWKEKVEKLRRIMLAGSAIEELPPADLKVLETWRAHTNGKMSDEKCMQLLREAQAEVNSKPSPFIWEPYSDERGEPEALHGWRFSAALYGINGQAWWLVKARHNSPVAVEEKHLKIIHEAVSLLGCHDTQKDLIRAFPSHDNAKGFWTMFWSWFHTGSLLEIHLNAATRDMLVVDEGTPAKAGYERMPRITLERT